MPAKRIRERRWWGGGGGGRWSCSGCPCAWPRVARDNSAPTVPTFDIIGQKNFHELRPHRKPLLMMSAAEEYDLWPVTMKELDSAP